MISPPSCSFGMICFGSWRKFYIPRYPYAMRMKLFNLEQKDIIKKSDLNIRTCFYILCFVGHGSITLLDYTAMKTHPLFLHSKNCWPTLAPSQRP